MNKRKSSSSPEPILDEVETNYLTEKDVFITEYVNESLSFAAILKQRYSDFQVHEIDPNGKIVTLSQLMTSEIVREVTTVEPNASLNFEVDTSERPVEELTYPLESEDQWKQLYLLLKRDIPKEEIRIDVTNLDKEQRTNLHVQIKEKFSKKLYTTVKQVNDRKYVHIGTDKHVDMRNVYQWTKGLPIFLHFVLYKENFDTLSAVQRISKLLKVNPKIITYAGNKDRRAVTTQWMCIRQVEKDRLVPIASDRIKFGEFEYKDEPLRLGQLKGNQFDLALRHVEVSDDIVIKTLENLRERGFINYFGLQRFGSYSAAPTFEIGRAILSKRWRKAIDLILKCRPDGDISGMNRGLRIWNDRHNAKQAYRALFGKLRYTTEGIILKTLMESGPNSFVNALQKIPRNVVLLYVHSVQSLIWNRIISRRIREFGLVPLAGDLVYVENNISENSVPDDEITRVKPVRAISEDEVQNVKIQDVVYPLPGNRITYPKNVIAKWYTEILEEWQIDFNLSLNSKMCNLTGGYRNMIVIPEDMSWKIVRYNDRNTDLMLTDYQKLTGKNTVYLVHDGMYKAVLLQFGLSSCCYATMLFREITRSDTSLSHQASLTFSHMDKKPKLDGNLY